MSRLKQSSGQSVPAVYVDTLEGELNRAYGGKGTGLLRQEHIIGKAAKKAGVNADVPKFEFVGTWFYDEFEKVNEDKVGRIRAIAGDGSLVYEQKRDRIDEIAYTCELPESMVAHIRSIYSRLPDPNNTIVRSSATCEDASKKGHAGDFESLRADSAEVAIANAQYIFQNFLVVKALNPDIDWSEKMSLPIQDYEERGIASFVVLSELPESLHEPKPVTVIEAVVGSLSTVVRGNSSTIIDVKEEGGRVVVDDIRHGFVEHPTNIDLYGETLSLNPEEREGQLKRLWEERIHMIQTEEEEEPKRSPLTLQQIIDIRNLAVAIQDEVGHTVDLEGTVVKTDYGHKIRIVQERPITGTPQDESFDINLSDLHGAEPIAETAICVGVGRQDAPIVWFDSRYARSNMRRMENQAAGLQESGNVQGASRLREEVAVIRANIRAINERFIDGYIMVLEEAATTSGPEGNELFSNRRAMVDPKFGSRNAHGALKTRELCEETGMVYLGMPGLIPMEKMDSYLEESGIEGIRASKTIFAAVSLGRQGMLVPLDK